MNELNSKSRNTRGHGYALRSNPKPVDKYQVPTFEPSRKVTKKGNRHRYHQHSTPVSRSHSKNISSKRNLQSQTKTIPCQEQGAVGLPKPSQSLHQQASTGRNSSTARDDPDGHLVIRIPSKLSPRYEVRALLGQGTYGRVVRAYDKVTQKHVAVKVIKAIQKYRDASRVEIKVLKMLESHDPKGEKRCIKLIDCFDYHNHVCMVFELFGKSLFDFFKSNSFIPFPMAQIQVFGYQVLESVAYMHELGLIHTDLKPENLLLENDDYYIDPDVPKRKVLRQPLIRLIDFGSTVHVTDYHASVVSTRHYRAPEIILGLGWSFPCDMWSIGCILIELFTGSALFQTHDNLEHLKMMEIILGAFPQHILNRKSEKIGEFFAKSGRVMYPTPDTASKNQRFVGRLKPLRQIVNPEEDDVKLIFLDLLEKLLCYDANRRLTAEQALSHRFFWMPLDS